MIDLERLNSPLAQDPRLLRPDIKAGLAIMALRAKRELAEVPSPMVPIDWHALPGPQTQGYECKADILFFGGQAGGGKSDLLLGLAGQAHRKSIIFRREFPQMLELRERSRLLFGSYGRFNGHEQVWHLHDGRTLEFGAVQHENFTSRYQGRPHDGLFFDELPTLLESQFRFLMGWNRTTIPGQRCRVVATGNPPTSAEGEWVIQYWGPWLDPQHPYPALPGQLRWYATIDGKDQERENGEPFEYKDELITPMSRTFIPSRVEDNPYLMASGYKTVLQNLPEPLRSKMLHGDFSAGMEDNPWQVIPTAWVDAAMARWTEQRPDLPLSALGVDVARGGCFDDETEILTNDGWKLFEKLDGTEQVLTLRGHVAEWGPITEIHKYPFDGYLNLYDGTRVNFCITDNHQLLVCGHKSPHWELRRFDELPQEFVIRRRNRWEGRQRRCIRFKSTQQMPHGGLRIYRWTFSMRDWAALVGWFVSEGCVYQEKRIRGRWQTMIAQRPGPKLEQIKALLNKMGIPFYANDGGHARGVQFSIAPIAQHLRVHCGHLAANKRVPRYIKDGTPDVIEAFLDTYNLGDGSRTNTGTRWYASTSALLMDDIQEMLVKLGRAGKISHAAAKGTKFQIGSRDVTRLHQVYSCYERQKSVDSDIKKSKVQRIWYTGYVYCVTTPLHTIMVRRHGCAMWSGNSDKTVLAKRYGPWFAPLQKYPGLQTPDGPSVAALVLLAHDGEAPIQVDVIGVGASAYDHLKDVKPHVIPLNGSEGSRARDRSGQLHFRNLRAEWHWKFREALDPTTGEDLALPPDREMRADLIAPRWKLTAQGIQIEDKEDIKARLGRSPDSGEAIIYAHAQDRRRKWLPLDDGR